MLLGRLHQPHRERRLGTISRSLDHLRQLSSLSSADHSVINTDARLNLNPDTKSRTSAEPRASTSLNSHSIHPNSLNPPPNSPSKRELSNPIPSRSRLQADSRSRRQADNLSERSLRPRQRQEDNKNRPASPRMINKRDCGATSAVFSTSCSMRMSPSQMTRMLSSTSSSRASHSTRIRNI